jgi:hypothetical protein
MHPSKQSPRPTWIAVVLLGLQPAGCKCGNSEPDPVGRDAAPAQAHVAPPPVATELPAERPPRFSVALSTEAEPETEESILLGNAGARQKSQRGRRSVAVIHAPQGSLVDDVYQELREFACDKVETELRRGEPKGGSLLQLTAGSMRTMIKDTGLFYPTPSWAGAFAGCSRALEQAFPMPGSSDYAELEIRFPGDQIPVAIAVETDLGPDHRGIEWRDDDATAIVYLSTLRPVDVSVRSGGGTTTVPVDLSKQRGVEIEMKPDAAPEELAVEVTALDDPASVKGSVQSGANTRVHPLDAPRLDLAGEPADRKPVRVLKPSAQ